MARPLAGRLLRRVLPAADTQGCIAASPLPLPLPLPLNRELACPLTVHTASKNVIFRSHLSSIGLLSRGISPTRAPKRYLLYKFAKLYWPLLMSLETFTLSALSTYFPQGMVAIFTPTDITILFP